jgi:hypothetical protein
VPYSSLESVIEQSKEAYGVTRQAATGSLEKISD